MPKLAGRRASLGSADDHVVADPRDGRAELRAGVDAAPGFEIVQQQVAEIPAGSCRPRTRRPRPCRHRSPARRPGCSCWSRRPRRRTCASAEPSAVGIVRVASRSPKVVLVVIGVEHVDHAVARPGKRAAGCPDHQLVADHRERGAELIAGLGVRVGEDVNQLAIRVGRTRPRCRWSRRRRDRPRRSGPLCCCIGAPIATLP